MRNSITVLLFLASAISFGQLPTFESNTSESDKEESRIYQNFQGQYELIISFTKDCYWPNEQVYYVFGYNADKWENFKWIIKFENRDKTKIAKTKSQRLKVSDRKIEDILNYWRDNEFLQLSSDSLNLMEKVIDKDNKLTMFVTDGCADRFDILTKESYRIVSAYLPDHFQKEIPVTQRKKFILSRDRFLRDIK